MRCESKATRLDVLMTDARPKTKSPTCAPRRASGKVTLRIERGASLEENDLEPALGQLFCCPTPGSTGTDHDRVVDRHVDTVTRLELFPIWFSCRAPDVFR
jgi:hypothetical protein